ncbi:MAG TPA: hypothetical protein PLN61_12620, partial [bacterium]|nr:hypothetical protein [bacterium]
ALVKQTVTIVRRDGNKVTPLGKAEILKAKMQQTVARRIEVKGMAALPMRAGDQAIARQAAYTTLGARE